MENLRNLKKVHNSLRTEVASLKKKKNKTTLQDQELKEKQKVLEHVVYCIYVLQRYVGNTKSKTKTLKIKSAKKGKKVKRGKKSLKRKSLKRKK